MWEDKEPKEIEKEGAMNYKRGEKTTACPYERYTACWSLWIAGYCRARKNANKN
jgi:hypothetical protein